jgi:hypothetical protein
MGGKLLVALQLEVVHHFIERRAGGPIGGFEPPATFGTSKTLKTLLFNPYQLPAHDRLMSLRSDEYPRALSRETKRSGSPLTAFFAAACCQIAAGNRHSPAMAEDA